MRKEELIEAFELIDEENFEEAHIVLKHNDSPEAAWLRAFLYRRDGDEWNANYWYDKAGRTYPSYGLATELEEIKALLDNI